MRRASSATELASPAHGLQPCWLPANTGALEWQWRIETGSRVLPSVPAAVSGAAASCAAPRSVRVLDL